MKKEKDNEPDSEQVENSLETPGSDSLPLPQEGDVQDVPAEQPAEEPVDANQTEEPLDGAELGGETPESEDDSTESLLNQLSPEDKEAARKYILSMIEDDNEQDTEEVEPATEEVPAAEPAPTMEESVAFSKASFKKVCENFGIMNDDEKGKKNTVQTKSGNKKIKASSPFSLKTFNKK